MRAHVRSKVAIAALMSATCSRTPCKNEAFYGLPSPDGQYIAFIFHRTCAVPPGLSTDVSLLPFHDSLRGDPGNVLSVAGGQPVTVSWQGPKTLRVAGYDHPTVQRRQPLDGIRIEFQSR